MNQPCADHTLLSRSGRVSKRARAQALKREGERLFKGVGDFKGTLSPEKQAQQERQAKLTYAAFLRDLAAKGMKPKKYLQMAIQLEAEADRRTSWTIRRHLGQ